MRSKGTLKCCRESVCQSMMTPIWGGRRRGFLSRAQSRTQFLTCPILWCHPRGTISMIMRETRRRPKLLQQALLLSHRRVPKIELVEILHFLYSISLNCLSSSIWDMLHCKNKNVISVARQWRSPQKRCDHHLKVWKEGWCSPTFGVTFTPSPQISLLRFYSVSTNVHGTDSFNFFTIPSALDTNGLLF